MWLPPQVVAPKELVADEEYDEILEDMREECGKYGKLVPAYVFEREGALWRFRPGIEEGRVFCAGTIANLVIPRPGPNGEALPGVGKVRSGIWYRI